MLTTAQAFRAWVELQGGTGKTALLLGCSAPHVSNICHGKRKPGRVMACIIERLGGPLAFAWGE